MLAERSDVSEELARLRSHIEQFGKLVGWRGEVGKKLDFLLQEMQREANTLFRKLRGWGGRPGRSPTSVCEIKAEIEKAARTSAEHRISGTGQPPDERTTDPVFVISGPSGSGKSTLVRKLLELPEHHVFHFVHNAAAACRRKVPENGMISFPKPSSTVGAGRRLPGVRAGFRQALVRHAAAMADQAQQTGQDLVLEIDVQGAAQMNAEVARARLRFSSCRLRGRTGAAHSRSRPGFRRSNRAAVGARAA